MTAILSFRALIVAALGLTLAGSAAAQDFYQGKTLRLINGSQPGISYYIYSQLLAPYLRKHIPGNPTVVVQNMPGAGGMVVANHVYNVAEKDGTVVGMFNRGSVLSALVGQAQAKFKPQDVYWLGTVASFADNAYFFIVRSALPHKTVADFRKPGPPVNVGNSGSPPILLLQDVLGFNVKVIEGYDKNVQELALERGELDGLGFTLAGLQGRRSAWVSNKLIHPVVQFGRLERHPDYPDVPTAREAAPGPDERAIIDLVDAPFLIAYPFGLAPGAPPDRADLLRKAFAKALADPGFRDEVIAKKMEYSPKFGEEVQSIVDKISRSPARVLERYKRLVGNANG